MSFIENVISQLQQIDAFVLLFRLVLIVILAGLIGWERESWNKPAGLRTHVLLGISAVLIAFLGVKMSEETGADASRIPAQLLSGIGFLGAGTILRDGFNVKGLTTAASLLTVTCIGLCLGFGEYIIAIVATLITYIILSYSHLVSDNLEKFPVLRFEVACSDPKSVAKEAKEIFEKDKIEMIKLDINNTGKKSFLELTGRSPAKVKKNDVISKLLDLEDVTGVSDLDTEK